MFLLFAHICIERTKSQRRHIHFGLVSARKLNEFIIHKLIWVIAEKRWTVNGDIAQFSWITKIECAIHLHNIYIYIYWLIILCLSRSPSLYILLSLSFSRSRTSMRNAFCLSVCISLLFILNLFYGCFSTLALKQQYHEYIDFRSIAFQSNETVLSIIFTMQNHQRQNFWMNLHKYRLVLLFILYVWLWHRLFI